jgi:protein-tyrosine phosphatase
MNSEANQPTPQRHVPLEGLHNLRDLGGYAAQDGHETRWGRIYRSDSPHRLTPDGVQQLEGLGVTTVIDLRHAGELESAPNPLASLPDYRHISLFSGLKSDPLTALDSLEALYEATLEQCGEAVREVIETVAHADGAVLLHCTAGKDRTGMISALLLLAVGVPSEDVVNDYALTAIHAKDLLEGLLEKTKQAGGDAGRFARFLTAEPETMRSTLAALHAKHGSARAYLESIGVSSETLAQLERRWLEPV